MNLISVAPMWRQGMLALLLLAPFFFISYGAANHWAADQVSVPSVVFTWESRIPFWPWTILPYWSIDLFYGLSLLLAGSAQVLRRQVLRLFTAQLICVSCFYLWPLRFTTLRPPLSGWEGQLFNALAGFDLPYNQAPSLHIVLLLNLWDFYRFRVPARGVWLVHIWSMLIGVSVLTTYQHHFIDIPTGLLVGALCLWMWPLHASTPWQFWKRDSSHSALAMAYGLGGLIVGGLGVMLGAYWSRIAWWLWWPAVSLLMVSLSYAGLGCGVFQKTPQGQHAVASRLLLMPYRYLAWINARCWTWRISSSVEIDDEVWLGRLPLPWERDHTRFAHMLDVTAELRPKHPDVLSVPMLDLVVPDPMRLREAAMHLTTIHDGRRGCVLVGCALGFSRSAAVMLTWLCMTGRARTIDDALSMLKQRRPQVVLSQAMLDAVACALKVPSYVQAKGLA